MSSATPETMEEKVSSIIEGACSKMKYLRHQTSKSTFSHSYVQLEFDKAADMEVISFELSQILRRIYQQFPLGASFPEIIPYSIENLSINKPLLIYSVNANAQPSEIRNAIEGIFQKSFVTIKNIGRIELTGSNKPVIILKIDSRRCESWGITSDNLASQLKRLNQVSFHGFLSENENQYAILNVPQQFSIEGFKEIPIKTNRNTIVRLKDFASISIEDDKPTEYLRVNGKTSIFINIYGSIDNNNLALSNEIKEKVSNIDQKLPSGYQLKLELDNSTYLEHEVGKNLRRVFTATTILLAFVFFAYRNLIFLTVLVCSLIITLLIVFLLLWALGITMQLYTIAGLAIASGIMIDNSIVMVDYFVRFRNTKIAYGLLAATLTTVSAVSLIYFLPQQQRENLDDFGTVIILSLLSSWFVSVQFIPAGLQILESRKKAKHSINININKKINQSVIKDYIQTNYNSLILFLVNYKKITVIIFIFLFGLPTFLLPDKINESLIAGKVYNRAFNNETFKEIVRPKFDLVLGGFLRPFIQRVFSKDIYRSAEPSMLHVIAQLPFGHSPAQMNAIIGNMESLLAGNDKIDKYVTRVSNGEFASIEITFKRGIENTVFPIQLKAILIAQTLQLGGVNWGIYGVGMAFSNGSGDEIPRFQLSLKGYNYDQLSKYAAFVSRILRNQNRVQNVNTNEQLSDNEKIGKEYEIIFKNSPLLLNGLSNYDITNQLLINSKDLRTGPFIIDNRFYNMHIRQSDTSNQTLTGFRQTHLNLGINKFVRLNTVADISLQKSSNIIIKEDRQYLRVIGFDYMGSQEFGKDFLNEKVKEINQMLPPGFSTSDKNSSVTSSQIRSSFLYIFCLIAIIYFISALMFENLIIPIYIIITIVFSFTGIFALFVLGDFYFDQGGYAAFLMTGGFVANAAIFIVFDCKKAIKGDEERSFKIVLLTAIQKRFKTIFLTTISTCCGLIPFVIEGQNEVFWYSLAVGTIGGLMFSMVALFFLFPSLLIGNERQLIKGNKQLFT